MIRDVAAAFDYTGLPAGDAAELQKVADRVRQRMQASIIDTGKDLIAVKEKLGHGRFGAWVDAEFGMTLRTAQNYMSTVEVFGVKSETVSHLPPATLYELAAPSTPAPVRAAIVERIESGEALAPKAVRLIIRDALYSQPPF